MATPLTPVVSKVLPGQGSIVRYVYEIPSVLPAMTSPRYELNVQTSNGKVLQFRLIYPNVTDTVGHVFTSDLGTRGTIDELIQTPTIQDGCFSQSGLGIYYENTDPQPDPLPKGGTGTGLLYFELDNLGLTPTGTITLELIIQDQVSG